MIPDLRDTLLGTWRTNNRVTVFLVEHLPPELWASAVPGAPRRTIRMIAGHLHNARCMWIKTLGQELGIPVPVSVDRRRVGCRELARALERSSRGISRLLALGYDRGGSLPRVSTYTWRNLPLDVGHVLAYFVAHEAHHRGQILLSARLLGCRLPPEVTAGLWQWTKRSAEAKPAPRRTHGL
ncbi:MAG TPA: DinB family protein [Gemmatimonadales bacterium]|nr:DinB family protein [Gemmatimonadales bacterium]